MVKPKRTILIVSLALQPALAGIGEAQIVNTLRGFDNVERGWSGRAEGTISVAAGNSEYLETQVAAAVQHQNDTQRWRLLARNMRLTTSGKKEAENRLGHLRHNYRFSPWLASVAFLQGQYNPFQRIETRILVGGGARFDLVRREKLNTAFGATFMREDEELTDSAEGFYTNYRFSFFTSVYRDVAEGLDIDITGFYQPLAEDPSDARAFASVALRFDIIGDLYLITNYSLEYDSRPPKGVEKSDQALKSGFGYEF
jgi:putative salt-induced outer membrane protein YdiY